MQFILPLPYINLNSAPCTQIIRYNILPTKAVSEITGKQTMLFDKRSSLIFNMMITNSVQSAV
ncbi:hypothetical protein SFRURICE_001662 [Spodoptera frugiperda]|nr:hypothetical protein SFRURICE_001662 [Spodoptera frugiperda]